MAKALIKLACRQVIDAASEGNFEQDVWNDSYSEFLIQIQTYNGNNQYKTWQDVKEHNAKAAFNIPYKVGFAIGLYVKELNGQIPYLQNSPGCSGIPFAFCELEILKSDITDKQMHAIALNYITDVFTFYGSIGDFMILAKGDRTESGGPAETFLLKLQPGLAIISYEEVIPVAID